MSNVFSSVIHQEKNANGSPEQRINKLVNTVPNEVIDRKELTTLIAGQQSKTGKFTDLLKLNEPWRNPGDPSTPILAAYEGDPVQLQLIQGAQEEQHVFSMNGMKWLAGA